MTGLEARRPLVLVVDDDYDVRDAVGDVLDEAGYGVAVAADGAEALDKLRAGLAPDLILLDIMMPGMDGYGFRSEQLRAPELAGIPVVVLSAAQSALDDHARLGASAYLGKPAHMSELLALVERVTGGSRVDR